MLVASCPNKDPFLTHRPYDIFLGDARTGGNWVWRGQMRDVTVFSRGLSDFEVSALAGRPDIRGVQAPEGLPACLLHLGEPRGKPVELERDTKAPRLEQRFGVLGDNEGRMLR